MIVEYYTMMLAIIAGLCLVLAGPMAHFVDARGLMQTPTLADGESMSSMSIPPSFAPSLSLSPSLSPTPLPSLPHVQVGATLFVAAVATQDSNITDFVAATNETSSLPLAWAGGVNDTFIPGMGRVLLPTPQPREVLPPTLLSPWYDYMTQPAIPHGVSYMSTMQGPYYWGTIDDRGPNDVTIRSSDVHQGFVGDCVLGASVIALAEAGRFGSIFPVHIAAHAPNPYFDVNLYAAPGELRTQHIDDMIPVRLDINTFFSYAPTPDAAATPATFTNANAVLAMPFIEKGFAKLLDGNPSLKPDSSLRGYAALTGIQTCVVMTGLTGEDCVTFDYRTYQNWEFEVFSLVTSTSPVVFGTPDTLEDFLAMGDNSLPPAQSIGYNDKDFVNWRTIDSTDYIFYYYQPSSNGPEYVFVADHAYGLMRGNFASDTEATLRNPWGANPDVNGDLTLPATITIPIKVLQRVMMLMYRG